MVTHAGGNTMAKTLEEIAAVKLPRRGFSKFIVAEISDGLSAKEVLVGLVDHDYHADIADAYSCILPKGIRISDLLGGGRTQLTDKTIYAYGYSDNYRTAPQETVQKLLDDYAKGKGLELKVEMGIGY